MPFPATAQPLPLTGSALLVIARAEASARHRPDIDPAAATEFYSPARPLKQRVA
jgi:hypothetical protein